MQVNERKKVPIKKFRDLDYIYDPNYTVSHHKDFYREARRSAIATSQCTIQPVYNAMFSELSRYERLKTVYYPNARLPKHVDISFPREDNRIRVNHGPQSVEGKHRALYFTAPKSQTAQIKSVTIRDSVSIIHEPVCHSDKEDVQSRGVQTLYRESSTQTEPYQPEFYFNKRNRTSPEILAFGNVNSSHGGNIIAVERLRKRRAWLQRALDFKVLSQLDCHDYNFREKEIEKILEINENFGSEILSTNDKEKLNKLWSASSQRLEKKILQIRRNKESELRKLDIKQNKMYAGRGSLPSTYVKKPIRLDLNLNYLPEENEFKQPTIDLNPKVRSSFGECDKFAKKRENYLSYIKKQFEETIESKDLAPIIDEGIFWEEKKIEKEVSEDSIIQEVEKVDKNVAADYLLMMLNVNEAHHDLSNIQVQFNEVKKHVMRHILGVLHKELDNIVEEKVYAEMSQGTDANNQDEENFQNKMIIEKISMDQLEMHQEVAKITKQISSEVLDQLFDEVSQKICLEEEESKILSARSKMIKSIENKSSTSTNTTSSKDVNAMALAEIVMDMVLPSVAEEIERRKKRENDLDFDFKRNKPDIGLTDGSDPALPALRILEPSSIEAPKEILEQSVKFKANIPKEKTEVLQLVRQSGLHVINIVFAEMNERISKYDTDTQSIPSEEGESISVKKSGELFVKDIIMNELLPSVIKELRRGNKLSSDSLLFGTEYDKCFNDMIEVAGVVQNITSNIFSNMIKTSTKENFQEIERTQSSFSTKLRRTFAKNIILDVLLPDVVEEIKKKHKMGCGYVQEENEIHKVMCVIQEAATDILNSMFTEKPKQYDENLTCTCSEEPVEEFVQNLMVESLPMKIKKEMDPRYYFETDDDSTETFVWELLVNMLPEDIRNELEESKDITYVNKMIKILHHATSTMFLHLFTDVSKELNSATSIKRNYEEDSFFMDIVMGTLLPKAMKEIQRRKRTSFIMSRCGNNIDEECDKCDKSEVTRVIEKAACGIVDQILDKSRCEKPKDDKDSMDSDTYRSDKTEDDMNSMSSRSNKTEDDRDIGMSSVASRSIKTEDDKDGGMSSVTSRSDKTENDEDVSTSQL